MKYAIVTKYWNPVDRLLQLESETPYLKKNFTNWANYAKMKAPLTKETRI